jgi:hypothetical protein
MSWVKPLFTVVLALIVGVMSLLPLPASTGQTLENRTVTVLLAVDEACTPKKHVDSFKTIISDISADLQRDFALQLKIEKCVPWKSHEQFSSLDTMFPYFYKTVPKKHVDIVIGLTCRENLEGEGTQQSCSDLLLSKRVSTGAPGVDRSRKIRFPGK